MRIKALITAILILLLAIPIQLNADRNVGSIDLSANPSSIPADGKSICTITAEVRDKDGKFVENGTEIRFSASSGVIEETGETSSGVARVRLESTDIQGTCIVTATWVEGQATSQINVQFGDVEAQPRGPRYVSVDADDYLAYSVDYKVLEALGNVKIRYRSLEMQAHEVQVDMEKNRIIARGGADDPVKLVTSEGVKEGSLFTCDLMGSRSFLISSERGEVVQVDFTKAKPEIIKAEEISYSPEEFDFADLSDSSVLFKAKQATVFPYDKIQFKKANLYVDGKRMFTLPLYVLSLTGNQADGDQYVGYSTGGLTFNLPAYYSLSPTSSGALLARYGESTGWGEYGQKPGWFMDLRQKYTTDNSQGVFTLSQITSGDWGAHFTHSQQLDDRTNGYLYLDYPSHRDISANLNLNRSFDQFNVGLGLYGDIYEEGSDSFITDLDIQTRQKPFGKLPFKYSLSSSSECSWGSGLYAKNFTQSLRGNLYMNPKKLSSNLTLRSSLGLGYIMGNPSLSGMSTLANAVLDWRPSTYNSVQLSYQLSNRASVHSSTSGASQSVSAVCSFGDGKNWRGYLYALRGLDRPTTTISGDLSYRIGNNWRAGIRSFVADYGSSSFNNLELELGYSIDSREVIAVWSQSEKKVMFELGSGMF